MLRGKHLKKRIYNDGIKNYVVFAGDNPESHWIHGMLRRKR